MEAKDTVMNDATKRQFRMIPIEPRNDVSHWDIDRALGLQAEISFKAGQDSVPDPWDREQDVFKAGIRKVVEWLDEHALKEKALVGDNRVILALDYEELKEWGIDEEVSDNIC